MIGIYAIYRKSDNKCMYVGQSKCIEYRIKRHFEKIKRFNYNEHYYKVVEQFDHYDKKHQLEREKFWINELNAELNIYKNNNAPYKVTPWNKGKNVIFSDEHKQNLSKSCKGKKHPPLTEEHKKILSEKSKGNKGCTGYHWKLVDGKRVYYK